MIELRKISAGYRGEPVLRDVDLVFPAGCVTVLLGPNGCGKSTLAKTIIRIYDPDAGTVTLDGVDFTALKGKRLQAARRSVQMVFQDPYSSLNPRMPCGARWKRRTRWSWRTVRCRS